MSHPIQPKFSFLAANASEDDESGTARWELPVLVKGEWKQQTMVVEFPSYTAAFEAHQAIAQVYKAGREVGRFEVERKVSLALLS